MPGAYSAADPLPGGELAAFAAAVEAGSVQGAADALALTQSAATKRIANLERRLGAEVFQRGRFGVRPTQLGRTIYPFARRALDALAEVGEAAQSLDTAGADLRLSASLTIGEFLLPGWLAQFRVRRPKVRPQLEVVNSSLAVAAVRERHAHIGFVEGLDPLDEFESLPIATDRLLVVVAASHHWARRRSVAPRELLTEPYVTREAASGTRAVADTALAHAGVALSPTLQAASLQSVKRTIAEAGFTLISELAIEAEQRAGILAGVPVRGIEMQRELHAIRRPRPRAPAVAREFWIWLAQRSQAARAGSDGALPAAPNA